MYVIMHNNGYDWAQPLAMTPDAHTAKLMAKEINGSWYKVRWYDKGYTPQRITVYFVDAVYLTKQKRFVTNPSIERDYLEYDDAVWPYNAPARGKWVPRSATPSEFHNHRLSVYGIDKDAVNKLFLKAQRYFLLHPYTPNKNLETFKKLKEFNG